MIYDQAQKKGTFTKQSFFTEVFLIQTKEHRVRSGASVESNLQSLVTMLPTPILKYFLYPSTLLLNDTISTLYEHTDLARKEEEEGNE